MSIAFRHRLNLLKLLPRPATSDDVFGDLPAIPNGHGPMQLGTPGEMRRGNRIRRLNLARSAAILLGVLCAGMAIGHNLGPGQPAFTERVQTLKSIPARQAVLLLPSAKRKCAYDFHERCTVCTHITTLGEVIQTSMC